MTAAVRDTATTGTATTDAPATDQVPAARSGRHRRPATPEVRPAAGVEATAALRSVERKADGIPPCPLPFPERAGLLIGHPKSGALAVSCNRRGADHPDAERFPCYAVIRGHEHHGDHLWLTYREARRGGWRLIGDVAELV